VLRRRAPGRAFAGEVNLQLAGSALRVASLVPWESPLYKAGVAQDDRLLSLGGVELTSVSAWQDALAKQPAGAHAPVRFVRRSGEIVTTTIQLIEDPRMEVVPIEKTGAALSAEQQAFRNEWLASLQKRQR
jgi:predicted metalloprotease with PDZ domain